MRIPKISGPRYAWLIIALSSALALDAPCAAAASLDGFVTNINSATSFDVGAVHIATNWQTRCWIQKSSPFRIIWGRWGQTRVRFTVRNQGKASSVPCIALPYGVGSRVHLAGEVPSHGQFAATSITVCNIQSGPTFEGGALLQEPPTSNHGLISAVWIDGYPLKFTPDTRMLSAPSDTIFTSNLNTLSFDFPLIIRSKIKPHHTQTIAPAVLIHPDSWAVYHATFATEGHITANRIRIWPNEMAPKEERYIRQFVPTIVLPQYTRDIPGTIKYGKATPIAIIPDQKVQELVSRLGTELIPPFWKAAQRAKSGKISFRFYVVRSFPARLGSYYVETTGFMPRYELLLWNRQSQFYYRKPAPGSIASEVIASPDGTILVPDGVLRTLQDQAQLAALLSYAITSVIQAQGFHGSPAYLVPNSLERASGIDDIRISAMVGLWQNEQALRIGIRQMYLAGYDIREAPFAWTVAEGHPIDNPLMDAKHPDDEIPGYAAYAFNYISQYYKNVDYSKLKRGRAEYQQFLKELYKADPTLKQPMAQASKQ